METYVSGFSNIWIVLTKKTKGNNKQDCLTKSLLLIIFPETAGDWKCENNFKSFSNQCELFDFSIVTLLLSDFVKIVISGSKLLILVTKGQLISKCPYEKSVSSKIPTKIFPRFLPWKFTTSRLTQKESLCSVCKKIDSVLY